MSEDTEVEKDGSAKANSYDIKPDFLAFIAEFKDESDRASVILGAAKLDQVLEAFLEAYLLPCPNSTDPLFTNNGPLGNFSSKIDMSFRLGLIDSKMAKSIHLIRKIRNEFAHELHGASLSQGRHKDRVKSLVSAYESLERYARTKRLVFTEMDEARAGFSTLLGMIVLELEKKRKHIVSITGEDAVSLEK